MTHKDLRKAAVSVAVYPTQAGRPAESWPPVIVSGPQDDDGPPEAQGRQMLDWRWCTIR